MVGQVVSTQEARNGDRSKPRARPSAASPPAAPAVPPPAAGSKAKARAAEEEEEEAKAAAMRAAAEAAQAEWRAKQEGRSWGVGGSMAPPGAQEAKPQPLPSLNLWQQLNLWQ